MINWFTVAAQVLNFILLVVLLKFLLYDRIIKAMDAREKKIADKLEGAEEKQRQAEREAEEYKRKKREQEEKRDEYLKEAREEAEQKRDEMIEQARKETDELRERWQASVRSEKDQFFQMLRTKAGREVCAVSRRALKHLADADLEAAMVSAFLRRVKRGGELQDMLQESDGKLTVFSSSELSKSQRSEIEKTLQETADAGIGVDFDKDEELACGLELRAGGRALGWNVADYVQTLQETFQVELEEWEQDQEAKESQADEAEQQPERNDDGSEGQGGQGHET